MIVACWLAATGVAVEPAYPDLRWRTLETEHFRVHYPESRRPPDHPRYLSGARTAQAVAAVADDLWLRIGDALGFFVEETVDVVVLEQTDTLEGFTIPQWDWIALSAHPGTELWRVRGRQDWVADVLGHELGHLFAHKAAGSLGERASYGLELGAFGESGRAAGGVQLRLTPHEATWWSEGGAEYLAERAGVTWWSSSRDMTVRASALEDRLLTWPQLQVAGDKRHFHDGERSYQQGYALLRWLDQELGPDAYGRMAAVAAKRYPARWDHVLEAVAGAPAAAVHAAHTRDLVVHYEAQREAIVAAGEARGVELLGWRPVWESAGLAGRDRWATRTPRSRERDREGTGTWNLYPRISADGAWFGVHHVGWIRVQPGAEALWPLHGPPPPADRVRHLHRDIEDRGLWLPARFGHGFAFVPGQDAVVLVASEHLGRGKALRPELDGYDWNQLYRVELGAWGGRTEDRYTPIPGTLRGSDPAVSRDGKRLAWLAYADGTTNLVVANLDGSDRRRLTDFSDGTWMQGPSWSPDGTALVVAMYRRHQANLWIVDAATGALSPLTRDGHDERDPHWAADGIYFVGDPDGVLDVYRADPAGSEVQRVTRVLGGAATPSVSPEGTLLYSHYTAFGWKAMGLARDEFVGAAAPAFDLESEPPRVVQEAAGPSIDDLGRPMGLRLMPPGSGPVLRLDGSPAGLQPRTGAYLRLQDLHKRHQWSLYGLAGEDLLVQGGWTWNLRTPDLEVWGVLTQEKRQIGTQRRLSEDRRQVGRYGVTATFWWNAWLRALAQGERLDAAVEDPATGRLAPFLGRWRGTFGLEAGEADAVSAIDAMGVLARVLWSPARSVLADPAPDDGERLGVVPYHQLRLDGLLLLGPRATVLRNHRLELGWQLVGTDRNIHRIEEVRAGGDHPYALRLSAVEPTAALPGFEAYAFSGENLAIGTLGWRFPLRRQIERRLGPVALDQLYGRLAVDAGNVWSWRNGRAELPGVDLPADHGQPVLADGVVELRLASLLFDARWDSFARFAWGFPEVRRSADGRDGVVPELATAPAGGPRVSVGLGTGW